MDKTKSFDIDKMIKILQNMKFYSSPYLPCNHFERDWIIKYHEDRKKSAFSYKW